MWIPTSLSTALMPPPVVSPDNLQELQLILLCVWGEARGEPNAGIEAVCSVIIDRWKAQRTYFGLTPRAVVTMHNQDGVYQFSSMAPQTFVRLCSMEKDKAAWHKVCKVCLPLLLDTDSRRWKDILYFVNAAEVQPAWLKNVKEVMRIGRHTFYRDARVGE